MEINSLFKIATTILGVVFIAIAAAGVNDSDTSLYHTQAIKWISEFGTVPGLGNIHGRFAFNSMAFPLQAMFQFSAGNVIITPINLIVISSLAFQQLYILLGTTKDFFRKGLAAVVVFGCAFYWANLASSPQPDVLVGCIAIYVTQFVVKHGWQLKISQYLFLSCLVCFGVTVKLSSVFLLLFCLPTIFKLGNFRFWLIAVVSGLFFFIPFLFRNYMLSGWLVYPFYGLDLFNPDWKIPVDMLIAEKQWITSWAIDSSLSPAQSLVMDPIEWMPNWFWKLDFVTKVLIIGQSIPLFFLRKWWSTKKILFTAYIFVLTNLLFWFLSAPDPRFVRGFLLLGLGLGVGGIVELIEERVDIKRSIGIVLCSVLIIAGLGNTTRFFTKYAKRPFGLIRPVPQKTAIVKTIHEDFDLFVPKEGGDCYNHPLPCTPYPNEKLKMRGETFSKGFRISP